MDVEQIRGLEKQLRRYLGEFDDCFVRSEPRGHLRTYVRGQLSDLPRKSVEPMALAHGIQPRTLQAFVSLDNWDAERMRDRVQWIVARDHAHPQAIGVIDDTGNPKKGTHTAGVQRQWCGNTGKIDNCVVGVHLSYVAGDFQVLLDSDLYLPEPWLNVPARRAEAKIPKHVRFRSKPEIALEQVRRALHNGIRVRAWTWDESYSRSHWFLERVEDLGQNYVAEVSSNFQGWLRPPRILRAPGPKQRRAAGPKRRYPRLARKALPASQLRNLLAYSPALRKAPWQRYVVKDGEKGPVVWEVKCVPFYWKQGPEGLPSGQHTLLVARNVFDPTEVKYFVSNLVPGTEGVTVEWLLWVAFSRWPIERCFELAKRELGMDQFEIRSWMGIRRHFFLTQVTHLFCARMHQQLREKNDGESVPNGGTGTAGGLRVGRGPSLPPIDTRPHAWRCRRADRLLPTAKSTSPPLPPQEDPRATASLGCRPRHIAALQAG